MRINILFTGLCGGFLVHLFIILFKQICLQFLGSLISPRSVLTAAHCPIDTQNTQVVLGAHQLTAAEPNQQRQTVEPANYRIHAQYNPSNLNNDIAILILPVAATLIHPQIQTIAFPGAGDTQQFTGEVATVSGWGRIADGSTATSTHLRSVTNTIITNAVCAQTFGTAVVIGSTICTATTGGRGACNGDSGGPLTVDRAGSRQLVGVVSFGAAAGCEMGHPAGFARVTSFRPWIIANWIA